MEEKRKRSLVFQALLLSLGCNIALLGAIYFLAMKEESLLGSLPYSPQKELTLCKLSPEIASQFQNLSMRELIEGLEDVTEIVKGVKRQSVILTLLVSHYDLDLERSLGYIPALSKNGQWYLLSEKEYQRVAAFLKNERYPYTFSRLVSLFQKNPGDVEFVKWLLYRPQILVLKTLAQRAGGGIHDASLLKLILEAGADPIDALHKELESTADFSFETWKRFLIRSIHEGSKTASYLLVLTDSSCSETLDRETQFKMVHLMTERTEEAHFFVQRILEREDVDEALRDLALKRYATFSQSTGS
jgi:hypothetical protein